MKKLFLTLLTMMLLCVPTFAMEQGGYGVDCNINYYNPDTNLIEDGGSANAALGEGMCRSATHTSALVEFDGTNYYVTIRLLLQSNTKDVIFWCHTGYDTYEQVGYEIMMEDAEADAIDYRFQVSDPFAPIKASMYVTPMGRATVWFIELNESSLSADTDDFVISVEAVVVEEELDVVAEESPTVEEADTVGNGLDHSVHEEESIPEEPIAEEPVAEPAEEPVVGGGVLDTPSPEAEETTQETIAPQQSPNYTPYILVAVLAVIAIVVLAVKKRNAQ